MTVIGARPIGSTDQDIYAPVAVDIYKFWIVSGVGIVVVPYQSSVCDIRKNAVAVVA